MEYRCSGRNCTLREWLSQDELDTPPPHASSPNWKAAPPHSSLHSVGLVQAQNAAGWGQDTVTMTVPTSVGSKQLQIER